MPTPTGTPTESVVLRVSLLAVAIALVSFGVLRRTGVGKRHDAVAASGPPLYTAPAVAAVQPTPPGEIAWEPDARAPVTAAINGDGVEDIIGFFRVWDGQSAWVPYLGAFDGKTLKPIWRSEPLEPQLVKPAGAFPTAVTAGPHLVVTNTSDTLRIYALASGEKELTLKLAAPVVGLCHPEGQQDRVWIAFSREGTWVDVATGKVSAGSRPAGCHEPSTNEGPSPKGRTSAGRAAPAAEKADTIPCTEVFLNALLAQATCQPAIAKPGDTFTPSYALTSGEEVVAFGTQDDKPFLRGSLKGTSWTHGFVADETKPKPVAPAVTDLAWGRVYAVYEKVYFDARLAAVDAKTGRPVWDVPLVESLPRADGQGRGSARGLVVTEGRVYVSRTGGGLDIFEAVSGKAIGTIGKQ